MYLYLAIAIPFLFVIGTVYSAIKEQRKLEKTTLQDILNKEQKKRLLHYKKHVASIDFEDDVKSAVFEKDEDVSYKTTQNSPFSKKNNENKYAFNVIKASSREYNTALLDKDSILLKNKENKNLQDDLENKENSEEDIYEASKLLDYDSYDKQAETILNKVDSLLDEINNKK